MSKLRLLIFIIFAMGCLSLRAEHLADSVRVHFRVNVIEIDTLLMGNDAAMRGFAERMSELSDRTDVSVRIDSIRITGAASPEGSIPYNKWLSERRAEAITVWLRSYFDFPDSIASFTFKGRDWRGALAMVEADPDVPYRDEVITRLQRIIDGTARRDGIAYLKALRGGVPYRYILRRHFPQLRASEVFIAATVEQEFLPADTVEVEQAFLPATSADTVEVEQAFLPAAPSDTVEQAFLPAPPRAYQFALKTNLIYDAALIPNLGVEFPIGRHLSVGANWMYAWWKNHDRNRHWRIYGGDVNARYYFGSSEAESLRPITGHHFGIYAQVLLFQIANGGKGYITGIPGQDIWGKPWLGAGVEYGYSKRISERLNLDFTIGLGYLGGEYRTYRPIEGCYVWQSTHRTRWFGPTKAEISLVWLIGKEVRR